MRLAGLIVFGVVVSALVLGGILRRLGSPWGTRLSLFAAMAARFAAGLIVAWTAVRAAAHGGYWFATLAVALGLLALGIVALAGFRTWALIKYQSDSNE